jgi:hypothetical protein
MCMDGHEWNSFDGSDGEWYRHDSMYVLCCEWSGVEWISVGGLQNTSSLSLLACLSEAYEQGFKFVLKDH